MPLYKRPSAQELEQIRISAESKLDAAAIKDYTDTYSDISDFSDEEIIEGITPGAAIIVANNQVDISSIPKEDMGTVQYMYYLFEQEATKRNMPEKDIDDAVQKFLKETISNIYYKDYLKTYFYNKFSKEARRKRMWKRIIWAVVIIAVIFLVVKYWDTITGIFKK